MNRFPFLYLLISCFLTVNFSFSQKAERIGYINMEYILSQMEDYKTANAQLEEKIGKWKKEIEVVKGEIKVLKDSLEIERPLLTYDIIKDRESEIEFEEKQLNDYQIKRFGVNGDWVTQELLLIRPIQDQVLNVVEAISKQKKFDKIFDQSADAILFYSEKKYDISDLVLKSILRTEKLEKLNLEFDDEKVNPEYEAKKKLIEETKAKKAEEVKAKRELLLKQRDEKRKAYQKRRDSLLELRKKKK
ncbi:MAG: OmpH family outer membrane protein [Flavobacteriaceae bacterium]|jgi:Skp family chaperone for outer membrane proteins|nr:OmpH family outer membrane protein [Flavobacteriaceae bacterium]MBT4959651.1 OmpH family outer membrane protein [Flavobacteriaceae bacterium]MBT6170466.1 OmpH family outer membrane protein [Flavobacteriaceae bacterium]MBT6448852.1 OmpH family outer membrane protein [Flavobacteriaceae bacterium]MBT7623738.1 OmpH family outer membrane protein [Flavobacteriaceae bacterium]